MNGILFQKTMIPASAAPDGIPALIIVTQEANGHAIWFTGFKTGTRLLKYFIVEGSSAAIEWAIVYAPKTDDVEMFMAQECDAIAEMEEDIKLGKF